MPARDRSPGPGRRHALAAGDAARPGRLGARKHAAGQPMQHWLQDRAVADARPMASTGVAMVLIDEASQARHGPLPWRRDLHAWLIDQLSARGSSSTPSPSARLRANARWPSCRTSMPPSPPIRCWRATRAAGADRAQRSQPERRCAPDPEPGAPHPRAAEPGPARRRPAAAAPAGQRGRRHRSCRDRRRCGRRDPPPSAVAPRQRAGRALAGRAGRGLYRGDSMAAVETGLRDHAAAGRPQPARRQRQRPDAALAGA